MPLRLTLAAAAALLGSVGALLPHGPAHAEDDAPLSDAPSSLHRAADLPPPTVAQARALAEDLLARLAAGRLDDAWLARHLRPPTHATGPDPAWRARWLRGLSPDRPLGRALRESGSVVAVLAGPTYQRVLLGPPPAPSAIVGRGPNGPVLWEIAYTTCALCPEETRFVADLLDVATRRGRLTGRLVPGIELDVTDEVARAGSDWVALLQLRNSAGGFLAGALRGATVCGEDGPDVRVCYAGGGEDTWRIRWHEGRWRVDYSALADDSPLRLSGRDAARGEAGRWRNVALDTFAPAFTDVATGAGVDIGYGAVDAWPDPRDGTVLLLLMDLDRVLAGIARVDPETREVIDRWPLNLIDDRARLSLEDWASLWLGELTDDGARLAIHAPGRTFIVDLASRRAELVSRSRASVIAWSEGADQRAELIVGRPDGLWRYGGAAPVERARPASPPLAVWWRGAEGAAVCEDGTVHDLATDAAIARVCCGRVTDAAALPAASAILATCAEPCDAAAAWIVAGAEPRDLPGAGSALTGASIAPDAAWWTTAQASPDGGVLVWRAADGSPVARLPTGTVRRVRWSPSGDALVTIEADGRVVWWRFADVVDRLGL